MKKPTRKQIGEMSVTREGAVDAAILKWEWLCQATRRQIIAAPWPRCGLCVYYEICEKCPLDYCSSSDSLYRKTRAIMEAMYYRKGSHYNPHGYGLYEFRKRANRMLKRIKEID